MAAMWMTRRLREREEKRPAQFGTVTIGGERAGVFARGERRQLPSAAPGGYAWRPRPGEKVLFIESGEGDEGCVAGVIGGEPPVVLLPGEICLYAPGGANLTLRCDGSIELNGRLRINGEAYAPGED